MMRRVLIVVWALLAALAAAGVIWFYVAGDVGDPTEVTAPPITTVAPEGSTEPQGSSTTVVTAAQTPPTSIAAEGSEPDPAPPEEPAETTTQPPSSNPDPGSEVELVLSEGTEARFLIFEELRGDPFTVVGVTSEVVGRVRVDRSDLSASQVGEILINARTFTTDSSNRDRAIRGPILSAEQHEFIVFTPRALIGLSGMAEPGSEWAFGLEGDLTVRDITRPVTFEVVARWGADDVLEGQAAALVLRSDFDLSIPSVPFVANVADEIELQLDFIARRAG